MSAALYLVLDKIHEARSEQCLCNEYAPDKAYICTRERGHGGIHVAHGPVARNGKRILLAIWSTERPGTQTADLALEAIEQLEELFAVHADGAGRARIESARTAAAEALTRALGAGR